MAADVVSAGIGVSMTCLVLARAVTTANRERIEARLRAGTGGEAGRIGLKAGRSLFVALLNPVTTASTGAAVGFWLAGPVGGLAGVVAAEIVLRGARSRSRRRARDLVDQQLREVMATLSASVRAGLSVRRAIEEAHAGSDPPLRDELAALVARLRVGQPIDTALKLFARQVDSPDAALLVTLLTVHRRTGGDLPALLDEVTGVVSQRTDTRRQVRALTAQGRASGAVLAVLPIAFVGLLSGTSGDGLGAFYRSLPGAGLLMAGLVCELMGFAWISRIVRTEDAP
ncbi:MAG TPA: type II secretion system F family protein [Actinomycetota bacterium]|nr:type II secretion system F family protein [Actinomycetota bacterium]